jgi:hypothetical protein
MAFPGEPFLARVADDIRFRREAARRSGVRFEYSRLHAAGLSRLREDLWRQRDFAALRRAWLLAHLLFVADTSLLCLFLSDKS